MVSPVASSSVEPDLEDECMQLQLAEKRGHVDIVMDERATTILQELEEEGPGTSETRAAKRARLHADVECERPVQISEAPDPLRWQRYEAEHARRSKRLWPLGRRWDPRALELINQVHVSHHIGTHRGLLWCVNCGAVCKYLAIRRPFLKLLSSECTHPTVRGEANRKRLAKDPPQLPHGYPSWPESQMLEDAELIVGSQRLDIEQ